MVLSAATRANVRLQIRQALAQSKVLKNLVAKKMLRVVGGLYRLHTGGVEFRLTRS